jgi:5-methylcytosine-specific restriction endonuclease McrA
MPQTSTERARTFRERNREKRRLESRAWQEENRERMRAMCRDWYQRNREKRLAYDKEHRFERRFHRSKRRALEAAAPGEGLTVAQFREICEAQGGLCAYCGRLVKLTIDHVVPIAKGGAHDPSNVVGACLPCNQSKSTRSLDEFLNSKGR